MHCCVDTSQDRIRCQGRPCSSLVSVALPTGRRRSRAQGEDGRWNSVSVSCNSLLLIVSSAFLRNPPRYQQEEVATMEAPVDSLQLSASPLLPSVPLSLSRLSPAKISSYASRFILFVPPPMPINQQRGLPTRLQPCQPFFPSPPGSSGRRGPP